MHQILDQYVLDSVLADDIGSAQQHLFLDAKHRSRPGKIFRAQFAQEGLVGIYDRRQARLELFRAGSVLGDQHEAELEIALIAACRAQVEHHGRHVDQRSGRIGILAFALLLGGRGMFGFRRCFLSFGGFPAHQGESCAAAAKQQHRGGSSDHLLLFAEACGLGRRCILGAFLLVLACGHLPWVPFSNCAKSDVIETNGHFFPIIGSKVGNFCLPQQNLKFAEGRRMDIPGYVLLSQEQALKRRMDIVANNMANSSTVGFRREQPVFHEQVERAREAMVSDAKPTSFVLDFRAIHDTSAGAFQPTGNPLDMMIEGPGYLAVQMGDGTSAYTRAGFVKVDDGGQLVTAGGQPILDEGGSAISVPTEEVATLAIGRDGTVSTRTGTIGRIAITVFDDETGVAPRGDGMMNGTGGRVLPAEQTRLRTGGVEGSNVQPIAETTAMIDILRSYQSSIHMADSLNDMRKQAISRLSRIN